MINSDENNFSEEELNLFPMHLINLLIKEYIPYADEDDDNIISTLSYFIKKPQKKLLPYTVCMDSLGQKFIFLEKRGSKSICRNLFSREEVETSNYLFEIPRFVFSDDVSEHLKAQISSMLNGFEQFYIQDTKFTIGALYVDDDEFSNLLLKSKKLNL